MTGMALVCPQLCEAHRVCHGAGRRLAGGESVGACVLGEELAQRKRVPFEVCVWGRIQALKGGRIGRERRVREHG